ncbi:MAG: RNA 2',3'-cyclic phosphodiesterase [Methylophilaceae bacterium]|nr:RNA 2',3'-cyclic phosphodiesterase [Methylophilaceae bacterium]
MKNNAQGKSSRPAAATRIRLFLALWPDAEVQQVLYDRAIEQQRGCQGRLMRTETLHLTLLFLGSVPTPCLPKLYTVLSNVHAKSFQLQLDAITAWRHNHIVYAFPTRPPEALLQLAQELRKTLTQAGFHFDHKPFVPHLTLLRQVRHVPPQQSMGPITWSVRQFALVQSVPEGMGVRYVILRSWPLDD